MGNIQKILAPIDFSEASIAAAQKAKELARDVGAALSLVHVINPTTYLVESSGQAHPGLFEDYERAANDKLKSIAASLSDANLSVEAKVVQGKPAEAIVEAADGEHADLLVMSTHGRSGIARLALGSVAELVVRTAHIPVLTMRP